MKVKFKSEVECRRYTGFTPEKVYEVNNTVRGHDICFHGIYNDEGILTAVNERNIEVVEE